MAEAAAGHLHWALADMARRNIESLTGAPWASQDVLPWLLPYRSSGADPALAARYEGCPRCRLDLSAGRSGIFTAR